MRRLGAIAAAAGLFALAPAGDVLADSPMRVPARQGAAPAEPAPAPAPVKSGAKTAAAAPKEAAVPAEASPPEAGKTRFKLRWPGFGRAEPVAEAPSVEAEPVRKARSRTARRPKAPGPFPLPLARPDPAALARYPGKEADDRYAGLTAVSVPALAVAFGPYGPPEAAAMDTNAAENRAEAFGPPTRPVDDSGDEAPTAATAAAEAFGPMKPADAEVMLTMAGGEAAPESESAEVTPEAAPQAEATEAFGPQMKQADADVADEAASTAVADAVPVPAAEPEAVADAPQPERPAEAFGPPMMKADAGAAERVPEDAPAPEAIAPVSEVAEASPADGAAAGATGVADAAEAQPAEPSEPVVQPFELVRNLQVLQDRIAMGSTEAFASQRDLLGRIEEQFAAADVGVWQDRRNAEALVTYVLSGGNPAILRRLLGEEPVPATDPKLMQGALAYIEGRAQDAKEQLAGIDPLQLPGGMASQVALAKAALNIGSDSHKAIQQLDIARLVAPGTLAEEAAIRREILVVAEHNDLAKFERLARQYFSRFRHSVYAGNFRQRFSAALTRMDFVKDEAQFGRLDVMLGDLDPATRLEIYLMVARAAVTEGKTVGAVLAAERALGLAKPGSGEEAQARLYRAAASAVSPERFDAATADLDAIAAASLAPADRALAQAAARTADAVRGATDHAALAVKSAPAPAAEEGAAEDEALPAITRAERALAAADALLEKPK